MISWRLVFVNVPLAVAALLLTLVGTPPLPPVPGARRRVDYAGAGLFAAAVVGLVYGLAQGPIAGWTSPATIVSLVACVAAFIAFGIVERRVAEPLVDLRLFRRLNFLAANLSQMLAGMIELGLGFLLPFYLLLTIGVAPAVAGIALIPGTIPIILAGPLAGRLFDRFGGRWPRTGGFLVHAASGAALALGTSTLSVWGLLPGLVLQGIGLGVVLTVNDPVGMNAVDEDDQGVAAGVINTTEQMGGAIGIAALTAFELGYYFH
jgi:MFS transporter